MTAGGEPCNTWDLAERPLPICDPDFHDEPSASPDHNARAFVEHAQAAHAFVLATPVYHNSYSGVLKNAIDTIAMAQTAYKPFGLIGHGGNRSTQAVDHLRIVVRGLLGVAIPTQVCTAAGDYAVDNSGSPVSVSEPVILERIDRFVRDLIVFRGLMASARA